MCGYYAWQELIFCLVTEMNPFMFPNSWHYNKHCQQFVEIDLGIMLNGKRSKTRYILDKKFIGNQKKILNKDVHCPFSYIFSFYSINLFLSIYKNKTTQKIKLSIVFFCYLCANVQKTFTNTIKQKKIELSFAEIFKGHAIFSQKMKYLYLPLFLKKNFHITRLHITRANIIHDPRFMNSESRCANRRGTGFLNFSVYLLFDAFVVASCETPSGGRLEN